MCVFGICYYRASSPLRAKASVLATADYWHLPPFGQERPATLRVFGTELLLCLFGFCYYSASCPVWARASVLAKADHRRLPPVWAGATGYAVCVWNCAIVVPFPLLREKAAVLATVDYRRLLKFGLERPVTRCVFETKLLPLATAVRRRLPPLGRSGPATLCVIRPELLRRLFLH